MTTKVSSFKKIVSAAVGAFTLFLASSATLAFTVDTATSPLTGLWNNEAEPGWGAAITQQYGMIFATVYTYDASGNPVWYVASSCPVSGAGCTGDLYKVTGGTAVTLPWNGANKVVNKVGTVNFAFSDNSTGTMNVTIDNAIGTKSITKAHFADPPVSTAPVTAACSQNNFTAASYNAIALGMTFDQVTSIIGCVYNPARTMLMGTTNDILYTWEFSQQVPFSKRQIQVIFDPTGKIVTDYYAGKTGTPYFKISFGF